MRHLKLFHRDVLTVRSHQWKYFVEPYAGCALQCTYCLHWETDAFVRRLYPPDDLLPELDREFASLRRRQIIYIGATVDPYQGLEKKLGVTRSILEKLLARGLPVVILTKSPLILRDLDLLTELNRRQLVMVQFTVLTTSERKARLLERAAPAVGERLDAAARLAGAGIPVHCHLSPVIPELYDGDELHDTVAALAANGVQCVYSNILGMRYRNDAVLDASLEALRPGLSQAIRAEYAEHGDGRKKVYSPGAALVRREMARIRDACVECGVDFICEFMPAMNAFDPARFEQGMFRHGLPAVYQMVEWFDRDEPKDWLTFERDMTSRFPAVDDEYLDLVKGFWDDGQLFENTRIHADERAGRRVYYRGDQLNEGDRRMAWD